MPYKLAEWSGDTVGVPQVVMAHLARADGDAVRVALYILQTGQTDPQALAKALGLKSAEAARRALQYWAGAGLLTREQAPSPPPTPEAQAAAVDLDRLDDPYVAVLCEEAQTVLGRALSRSELQRLVALYLDDGWQPDVLLLCCAETARHGRHTVGAVGRELERWRQEGVETGEDAEAYLRRQADREAWCAEAAALLGLQAKDLTRWERAAVARWHEEWHCDGALIEEAALHAEGKRTVRYVDGILRSWHAQGLTTVAAVRGKGQLAGSNILATGRRAPRPAEPAAPARSWNALLDEELEGMNDAYKG